MAKGYKTGGRQIGTPNKRTAKAAKYSAKKKKQAYIDGIPNIIQFFSDELVNYANGVFLSINGKVLNADKKDDDW